MTLSSLDLQKLNSLSETAFQEALTRCCGSHRWVEAMQSHRPFADMDALLKAAEKTWWGLSREDWLEAFQHHPKIGDINNLRAKFANTKDWAQNEQSGVDSASEDVIQALAEGNTVYETKFGHIFIVCATGKTASEMLEILQSRLPNPPEEELRVAAGEQNKITRLRLEKLAL